MLKSLLRRKKAETPILLEAPEREDLWEWNAFYTPGNPDLTEYVVDDSVPWGFRQVNFLEEVDHDKLKFLVLAPTPKGMEKGLKQYALKLMPGDRAIYLHRRQKIVSPGPNANWDMNDGAELVGRQDITIIGVKRKGATVFTYLLEDGSVLISTDSKAF